MSASPGAIPTIKVTMLGDSGSGKTTFMVAMLGSMLPGELDTGYSVHAGHRSDGLDLVGSWGRLRANGRFPDATPAGGYKEYKFRVSRSASEPLLNVDWLDYRGEAIADGDEHPDAAGLVERLAVSDSIFVALDGEVIGKWVADLASGKVTFEDSRQSVQIDLGILYLSQLLLPALQEHMTATGGRLQSIVVLLTKADRMQSVLADIRMPWETAAEKARNAVERLFDIPFRGRVRSLVNTSSVNVTPREDGTGNAIRSSGFRPPFLFAFRCYAVDASEALDRDIAELRRRKETLDAEYERVSKRLFSFGKTRIDNDRRAVADLVATKGSQLQYWRDKADRLDPELRGLPIYDGTISGRR